MARCRVGQILDGLAAIDEALARSARNQARWCLPELLRIKGALLPSRLATTRGSAVAIG